NLGTILHADHRTVRQLVQLALTTVFIGDGNGTGTRYRDQIAVVTGNRLHVLQTHGTILVHLHTVGSISTRSRTTDVERTHGQLSTRLTNGLSSDNTHGLTHVHLVTATEVTTVTGRTDTDTALTGNGRAHQNFVDAFGFDLGHPGFVDQSTGRYPDIAFRTRLVYIGCHHTTQNTVTKGYHHVTAFDQRSHDQTFFRAAIVLGHYQILCHVNQTTGQVTGVRSLQSGIRQTLTRTVGGGEVLQYVQTFTEVRGNRRFNNRTVRLGHQTTHTRQLTDPGRGAPRAGVGHHIHRVEGLLILFVTVAVDHFLFPQVVHHRLGYQFVGAGPDVDNLVVLLAVRHQTGRKLAFNFFYFSVCVSNDFCLGIRNHEVVHTDRRTRAGGVTETGVHHLVGEANGVLQAHTAVRGLDHVGNRLLLHRAVYQFKRQSTRYDAEQQRPGNSGIHRFGFSGFVALLIHQGFGDTHFDLGLQVRRTGLISTFHFVQVGKQHAFALGVDTLTGHPIQTQYHVLRRYDDRITVGRRQYVVGCHHQRAGFQLRFNGQRYVDRHLVTVEVGVIGRTHQRVQLNRFTFNQLRF